MPNLYREYPAHNTRIRYNKVQYPVIGNHLENFFLLYQFFQNKTIKFAKIESISNKYQIITSIFTINN